MVNDATMLVMMVAMMVEIVAMARMSGGCDNGGDYMAVMAMVVVTVKAIVAATVMTTAVVMVAAVMVAVAAITAMAAVVVTRTRSGCGGNHSSSEASCINTSKAVEACSWIACCQHQHAPSRNADPMFLFAAP